MGLQEDVIRAGKKLEKLSRGGEISSSVSLDILQTLKKLPMTLDVLQKTRIGMIVNSFRKTASDEEVISLSKSLIRNWKKLLPDNTPSKHGECNKEDSLSDIIVKNNIDRDSSPPTTPVTPTPRRTSFPMLASDTSDSVRLKCRELITKALEGAAREDGFGDAENLAACVEDAIFKEFTNTDTKYKTRIRSRIANLKDPKNPRLRENLMLGYISPAQLAKMTAEEMASDEMKNLRAKLTKESIDDHQMAMSGGTKSDLLQCGKCKKRNCTYNQVQTRSADEPMTTFVFCNECGNRWKFC